VPAHRKKPQTRRNALYTALVVAVAIFVALIGFGGKPRHSTPAAETATNASASPSPSSSDATPTPSSSASASASATATATPTSTPAPKVSGKVKQSSRPLKPSASVKPAPTKKPATESTGLGTSDASLKALAARQQTMPVRIQIPALHVDAQVIPVGVTSAGALEVPENVVQAAWFQAGNAPGQAGTSIIAAHVDFNGKLGLFNQLHTLKKGDVIIVTDYTRHVHRFTAVTGRLFPKSDPSTVQSLAAASAKPGQPQLALITCGGALDTQKHSYYDNFVLLANA
jgi:sortase (surface protein transpeptidase)